MSEAGAAAKKLGYIGGARFSTSVPSDAIILLESADGSFTKFEALSKPPIKEIHLISPLYSSGSLMHENEKVEYICRAFPVPQAGMKLSKYPKLVTDEMKAKILSVARMCAPQQFARMHEQSEITDDQSTDFWGFPYSLTYTFKISTEKNDPTPIS